ncbi:MAG: dihydrolipoyl dehydrogenase [Ignavibacteriales bacterium]|nr:dihydrolipoyl dehydrogenase [Ignavibacteriales bacterium]
MKINTELAVIGAGPGGYTAAFLAADMGIKVTLIDKEENPGGVCLYRGCIPSKALLHIAKLITETQEAEKWGIKFNKPEIDIDKLREFKNSVVNKLTGGLGVLVNQRKINYVKGTASFLNSTTLLVEKDNNEKIEIEFEKAILATGSVPIQLQGIQVKPEKIMNSTQALEIEEIPKRLLVIGGGYIGLELGSVYSALGSKVTFVEMLPSILTGADRDLKNIVYKKISTMAENIFLNTKVVSLTDHSGGVEVTFDGDIGEEKTKLFDKVLSSIGRRPSTVGLGLENTKVKITEKGFVEVNEKLETNDPTIYAIGDIIGNPMLAHKASAEAKVTVKNILKMETTFNPKSIPAVVFTDPELAWCGITEIEAKEKNLDVEVARFPWSASGRATTIDRNEGITKLIIDKKTEIILGVGIVGVNAGELIAEGAMAVELGLKVEQAAEVIHAHPTLSETFMEASELFFGKCTHLYRPKKK